MASAGSSGCSGSFACSTAGVVDSTGVSFAPFAPGDAMALAFDVAFRPRGFPNEGIQKDVVANGAYFNRTWMPLIGYQPAFELTNEETRTQYGLGPRPPMPAADAAPRRAAPNCPRRSREPSSRSRPSGARRSRRATSSW